MSISTVARAEEQTNCGFWGAWPVDTEELLSQNAVWLSRYCYDWQENPGGADQTS